MHKKSMTQKIKKITNNQHQTNVEYFVLFFYDKKGRKQEFY